jgi:transcriptional regulator with XRE-family HTH domain
MLTNFGKALDRLMEEKRKSNKDLAEALNTNKQYISNLKRAKRPHYRTLRKLAAALGVEESRLESMTQLDN